MSKPNTYPALGGTLAQTMGALMARALDRLDARDLEQITFERDDARHIIGGIADMAENLSAVMYSEESAGRDGLTTWAGAASGLLASLGSMARHADAMLAVAQLAEDELSRRMEDRKEQ